MSLEKQNYTDDHIEKPNIPLAIRNNVIKQSYIKLQKANNERKSPILEKCYKFLQLEIDKWEASQNIAKKIVTNSLEETITNLIKTIAESMKIETDASLPKDERSATYNMNYVLIYEVIREFILQNNKISTPEGIEYLDAITDKNSLAWMFSSAGLRFDCSDINENKDFKKNVDGAYENFYKLQNDAHTSNDHKSTFEKIMMKEGFSGEDYNNIWHVFGTALAGKFKIE